MQCQLENQNKETNDYFCDLIETFLTFSFNKFDKSVITLCIAITLTLYWQTNEKVFRKLALLKQKSAVAMKLNFTSKNKTIKKN